MSRNALIKYLCALLLFGSNGIVASHIALSSYQIVFLRTLIGSILLIVLFLLRHGEYHIKTYKKDAIYIALSGSAMGMSWMFLYEAYQQIGVSFSSLLYYCGPVLVMILSPILFHEKLTIQKLIGFAVVLIGIFLVNGNAVLSGRNTWGLFCGAMSAVMYFLMVTLNKQAYHITEMENSVIQLTMSFFTVAAFIVVKQAFIFHIASDAWFWIAVLGVFNTGIGCYLYFSPLSKLPAQTVAVCGYLEPLSAVIFSALLLGEQMSVVQMIGAVCIIGGAMVGELIRPTTPDPSIPG